MCRVLSPLGMVNALAPALEGAAALPVPALGAAALDGADVVAGAATLGVVPPLLLAAALLLDELHDATATAAAAQATTAAVRRPCRRDVIMRNLRRV
jgi:hypothetical protein